MRRLVTLLSLSFLLSFTLFGQNEFYVNGAAVTIENNALLYVDGEIIINTGTLENSGEIELTGDWTNNAANSLLFYVTSFTNEVSFLGSNQQFIGGTQTTEFENLTINNTAGVTLNVDAEVGVSGGGVLTLTDGAMELNSNTLLVSNKTTGAIARSSGYIKAETVPASGYGIVDWVVGTNMGTYVVPFGAGNGSSDYIPFTFDITSAGAGTNGSVATTTYPTDVTANPNNRPLPTGVNDLTDQGGNENAPSVIDRFWDISYNNFTSNPVSDYTFSYLESEWDNSGSSTNSITESNLVAQYWDGNATWNETGYGSSTPASNYVSGVTGFDISTQWTLVDNSNLLDVRLLDLAANPIENKFIRVNWLTTVEVDNKGFEVQRSADKSHFETIAWVEGQGTANGPFTYSTDDHEVAGDVIYYYRLKILSNSGNITYSPVVSAMIHSGSEIVIGNFYPNPTSDLTSLPISVPVDAEIHVSFFNTLGQETGGANYALTPGNNLLSFKMDDLAFGSYLAVLEINGVTFLKKVVKIQ